jgi:hypothetical protein
MGYPCDDGQIQTDYLFVRFSQLRIETTHLMNKYVINKISSK